MATHEVLNARARSTLLAAPLKTLLLAATALAAVTLAAAGARPLLRHKAAAASPAPPPRTESAVVTARPTGFEPVQITPAARGAVRLVVHNRSGLRTLHLLLTAETGERLHEVSVPLERPDWSAFLNLHPGRYFLTEADHPDWRCEIRVGP